ncbi:lactonase family protein [Ochrobactrum teleogrylli]|nr:lactonase family protein [[Ochrobactrum] teleogrylli]
MTEQNINPDEITLIIGSYTDSLPHVQARGQGISVLRLSSESGRITPVSQFAGLRNPTYLTLSADKKTLYAVEELSAKDGAAAAALSFDKASGDMRLLGRVDAMGDWPCHVALDKAENRLFVSNYLSGNFITCELDAAGVPTGVVVNVQRSGTGPNESRQEGPHVHCAAVTPDGNHVLICDAGTDEIARYSLVGGLITTTPDRVVKTRGGFLPRHMALSTDGSKLFVVHELGCSVSAYALGDDAIRLIQEISTLPADFTGESACAAIRVHPNGRFVYASNRGHDTIVAFKVHAESGEMEAVGWYSTRGETPRDFAIDPSGRYLVAANQDGHSLTVYEIDQTSGSLSPLGETYEIGSPVSVVFA